MGAYAKGGKIYIADIKKSSGEKYKFPYTDPNYCKTEIYLNGVKKHPLGMGEKKKLMELLEEINPKFFEGGVEIDLDTIVGEINKKEEFKSEILKVLQKEGGEIKKEDFINYLKKCRLLEVDYGKYWRHWWLPPYKRYIKLKKEDGKIKLSSVYFPPFSDDWKKVVDNNKQIIEKGETHPPQ